MTMLERIEGLGKHRRLPIGFVLFAVVGGIDLSLGYEYAFSLFYLLPVVLVSWNSGPSLAVLTCLLAASIWLAADLAAGHPYTHPLIPLWNATIRFSFFLIVARLLAALLRANDRANELSRIDSMTGAVTASYFYELTRRELDRMGRYSRALSLAYIDLDNFKTVNDEFGHPVGDQVLHKVVEVARQQLRRTDVVARLGGDEFALLLPEMDAETAKTMISRLQSRLLQSMESGGWPVTFSIGVITCISRPSSMEALVKLADTQMYAVKHSSKNAVRYSVYSGP